ncbi:hypothetical protein K439DRAFT_953895 [Ramaria rubella]|nr:hypothetical protein K439DRAFT_953895 [Ramaria rubella]
MHHIFRVAEIFSIVLDNCDQNTLSQVTRVCNEFHGPSVAHLWESLNKFEPLLDTLRRDIFNPDKRYKSQVVRHLVPDDWEAFTRYASHVRNLSVELDGIHHNILEALALGSLAQANLSLLPRMTALVLKIFESEERCLSGSTVLLSSSLMELTLHIYLMSFKFPGLLGSFWATLSHRSAHLTRLIIKAPFTPGNFSCLSKHLCSLKSLKFLQIAPFHFSGDGLRAFMSILPSLSGLKSLETLHTPRIHLRHLINHGLVVPQTQFVNFPALKQLRLLPMSIEAPPLLDVDAALPLVQLVLVLDQFLSRAKMAAVIKDIEIVCKPTLQILQVLGGTRGNHEADVRPPGWDQSPETFQIDDETLEPLLAFHSLVELKLTHEITLAITDDFLGRIPVAFPNIHYLSLGVLPTYTTISDLLPPLLTKRGLIDLTTKYPKLQSLDLHFDATKDIEANPFPIEHLSTTVTGLNVGRSWIDNPALTAAWMSDLFPSLETLRWDGDHDTRCSWSLCEHCIDERVLVKLRRCSKWNQVNELLTVFRKVRKQEQARIEAIIAFTYLYFTLPTIFLYLQIKFKCHRVHKHPQHVYCCSRYPWLPEQFI